MRIVNLGVLAHVDAGKTSLTERLLFDTGAIARLGSVDGGNTQTDSLALERQRGITIAAAVVSFQIGDLTVNLIDTPGHPDFIAEVERILQLLDAAVVVVSAVEGVQAQTRVLVRALKRLGIPFLLFVNKIDRLGAGYLETIREVEEQLSLKVLPMCRVTDAGSRHALVEPLDWSQEPGFSALCETLTANDEALLGDYVMAPETLNRARLETALAAQVARGLIHPAYCGIAMTGLGLPLLIKAIETLLPARAPDPAASLEGTIFKIERGWGGEKLAYLNLTSGTLGTRDLVDLGQGAMKVTGIELFTEGRLEKASHLPAGRIGKVAGLANARIGDRIGGDARHSGRLHFAPPTLETQVLPKRPSERAALWLALQQLSEQDPLINLRVSEDASDMFVSLYGEVQKEIIGAVLLADFGLEAVFEESTVISVERLIGQGSTVEVIFREPNPFLATVGLRVEPRPEGAGNSFAFEVEAGQMPISFYRAVEETVFEVLKSGIHGWQVIDCHVAMTAARHSAPSSTAADFRRLTPLVLAAALTEAGTFVCEPVDHFHLEAPVATLPAIHTLLAKAGAVTRASTITDGTARLDGVIASSMVQGVQRQLPALSSGAGVMETGFDHYAEAAGPARSRVRVGANPFDREAYLARVR